MGTRRYSRDCFRRRWEERFDELQTLCRWTEYDAPMVGDLLDHDIPSAHWTCRNYNCMHSSEPFLLDRFGRSANVAKLRRNFVCSKCGTGRPHLRLIADD
jgi:hypothetical protein